MTNAERRQRKAAAKRIERVGHLRCGYCVACYHKVVKGRVRCRKHLDEQALAKRKRLAERKKLAKIAEAAIRIAEIRAVQEERIRLGLPLSVATNPTVPKGARPPVEI